MMDASDPRSLVVRGDARRLPVRDASVQCVCTSPPFFGLRRYEGVDPTPWPTVEYRMLPGAPPVRVPAMTTTLGNEPDVESYVGHLVVIFRRVRECLRTDGTLIVNIGDSYAKEGLTGLDKNSGSTTLKTKKDGLGKEWLSSRPVRKIPEGSGLKPKDLMMVLARVALALVADGWYLRAEMPWIKYNSLPSSVTDRPTVSHEWLYLFSKRSSYFWDADAARVSNTSGTLKRLASGPIQALNATGTKLASTRKRGNYSGYVEANGRNLRTGDVFFASLDALIAHHLDALDYYTKARARGGLIADDSGDPLAVVTALEPFKGKHYAAFPRKLVEPLLKCAAPEKSCAECGAPYRRVVERPKPPRNGEVLRNARDGGLTAEDGLERTGLSHFKYNEWLKNNPHCTVDWQPTCRCPQDRPPVPSIVADIFAGSSTTGVVCQSLGRRYVGIDVSPDYCQLAHKRLTRPHAPSEGPAVVESASTVADSNDLPLFRMMDAESRHGG